MFEFSRIVTILALAALLVTACGGATETPIATDVPVTETPTEYGPGGKRRR